MTGAVTKSLGLLFGPRDLDLDLRSAVTQTSRHYDTAAKLNRETMDVRIWLSFHFRRAMTDGNALGQKTAAYVASASSNPSVADH